MLCGLQTLKIQNIFILLQNFFYSRKNFMKPTHQEFPHRNFQEEVDFLSQIFPSMECHTLSTTTLLSSFTFWMMFCKFNLNKLILTQNFTIAYHACSLKILFLVSISTRHFDNIWKNKSNWRVLKFPSLDYHWKSINSSIQTLETTFTITFHIKVVGFF